MFGKFVNLLVWLLVAAWIVASGWDEPLKYRFMTPEARAAEEKIIVPPPPPTPAPPDYRKWGTPAKGGSSSLVIPSLTSPTPRRYR
jgi:hypothetical protein